MKSNMISGCLIGIILLLVTGGGGILIASLHTPRFASLLYGALSGLSWGWLIARSPRHWQNLTRMRRLLYWEIFLAVMMLGSLLLLFLSPQTTSWNKWWIFLLTLVFTYNTISALFRFLRIRLLTHSATNK